MNRSRTARISVVFALVALLAACGGGDDAVTPTDPVVEPPASSGDPPEEPAATGGAVSPPSATIPDEVPDEYLPAIGPVDVTGDPLPALDGAEPAADPAVGALAPTLVGLGFDGQPVRVDAAADGPTMVVFLAHWCPHCNAEVPRLTQLRDEGRLPEWLNVVAVATASDPQRPNFPPGDWLERVDWTWPAIADGVDMETSAFVAAQAFGVDGFPFVVLLDGDGKVAARWSGESEPDEIVARIDQYLGG